MNLSPLSNPLAPEWMLTGSSATPEGYTDEYREYSLSVVLAPSVEAYNQVSRNNDLNVWGAGCFLWMLTKARSVGTSPYIMVKDHLGRFMFNEPVLLTSFCGPGEYGAPLVPVLVVPQGGQLTFDLYEVDLAGIDVSIVVCGIQRRRLS